MVNYEKISEELGHDFISNPANFVTEADLQFSFARKLVERVTPAKSTVENSTLKGTPSGSFKRDYWKSVQDKLEENSEMDRVHTEVSIEQGERLDVAVFKPQIELKIEWISGGSKRFDERDLEAAFEIKFVKNKYSFPFEAQ